MSARHVAPARQVFTVAHVADPAGGDPGATLCGQAMLTEDVWIGYDPLPEDPICPACLGLEAVGHGQGDLFGEPA